jgi:V-type H+-transporting ATPase subunit a
MCLGIILSALNAINFRKPYNFFFEFVPQIIFMLALFGYLCFLIIYKARIPLLPWFRCWIHLH